MRFAGFPQMLLATLVVAFFACGQTASAQLFAPRKPKTSVNSLIGRQAPPQINREVEARINSGNSSVRVSLSKQRIYLMAGDEVYIDSPVSSGKAGHSTPSGSFRVMEKDLDHRSSIYGDFVDGKGRVVRSGISLRADSAPSGTVYRGAAMKYFCRLTDTGVGMHIGYLPGYPASHGCVRLPSEIAPIIYRNVKVGTPVTIEP